VGKGFKENCVCSIETTTQRRGREATEKDKLYFSNTLYIETEIVGEGRGVRVVKGCS